jgi:NhaA family Na+:H+ antiporter
VKSGIARLPSGVSWLQVYGVACLTGVGFTMSLFIGSLAFSTAEALDQVRLGVLMGSVASGLLGFTVLRLASRAKDAQNLGSLPAGAV